MIGVIVDDVAREIVREFFELFKTPWEFYIDNRYYDVVISTKAETPKTNSKLMVIYGSDIMGLDRNMGLTLQCQHQKVFVEYHGIEVPIYDGLSTFRGSGQPLLFLKGLSEVAGLQIESSAIKICRLGYDLFQEVYYLLLRGQPEEKAHIPTLEIHISILRNLILDAEIPLLEVPPVPAGYDFIACLTHDVDFAGIRHHKFDHTMWGFLNRATIGSLLRTLRRRLSLANLIRNWKAAISLPLVYAGVCTDFWVQFCEYIEIEKDLGSTFFLIPFKKRAGHKFACQHQERRATRYNIKDIREYVEDLLGRGHEIAVHGIDAWHSRDMALQELSRISEFTRRSNIGIRMHWLYLADYSHKILDEAGFFYDSTFGYNETVGFRAGTTQVFRPLHTKKLLELPMHIQDTTLFFPRRMGLSENQAWDLCQELINNASTYGGVLTINWHQRSLAPERLWGNFYLKLLEELRLRNAWFATAGQIVEWFLQRRALSFDKVKLTKNKLRLRLQSTKIDIKPPLLLRIYRPGIQNLSNNDSSIRIRNHSDILWSGKKDIEISI